MATVPLASRQDSSECSLKKRIELIKLVAKTKRLSTPWKINGWNPKLRFGSDDFPLQLGDFYVPAANFQGCTPLKFSSSPLKNGGWKTILSYLGPGDFPGANCKTSWGVKMKNTYQQSNDSNIYSPYI